MLKLIISVLGSVLIFKVLDELSLYLFGQDNTKDWAYGVLFIVSFFGMFLTFDPFLTNCMCIAPVGLTLFAIAKFFIRLCIGLRKYISRTS